MFEENKKEKKKLLLTLVGVLTLIVAVVGVTYAAWSYTFNGTSTNTLSTADISLELLESDDNVINITNALPMDDTSGKAQTDYFDFVVTSKTVRDIDVDYTVSLQKLDPDTGYTSLSDNQIKLYLTDLSGTAIWTSATNNVQKVSDLSSYVLTTGQHSHDSTHNKVQDKYRLRVWIDSSVDASSWTSSTKYQYKFRLGVTGGEHVNTPTETAVYRFSDDSISIGDTLASITGSTPDYTTLNKQVFLKHVIGNNNTVVRNDVCFIRNNTLYCLKGVETANAEYSSSNPAPYYQENYNTLLEAFGPNAIENEVCSVTPYRINCSVSGIFAETSMLGDTDANDGSWYCYEYENGDSLCEG